MAGEKSARKTTRKPKARAASGAEEAEKKTAKPSKAAEAEKQRLSSAGRPEGGAASDMGAAMVNMGGMANMPEPMSSEEIAALGDNLQRLFQRGRDVWEKNLKIQVEEQRPINLDPFNTSGAFTELWQQMMSHPQDLAESTLKLWADQAELWRRTMLKAVGAPTDPMVDTSRDKRFKDKEWSENAVFDAIKQSYLLSSAYLQDAAHSSGDLDEKDRKKVEFFTRQFVEAMSPSNFFATNPEVLRSTFEEKGANLLRGFENLLEDLERGRGTLMIRQTDMDKFKVGENMAVTPGKVIFRNDLIELIQYTPTTETVEKRPILICPPWINKYYILDLNPEKSMVRWLVEQGHSVFVISWVNPDEKHSDKEFVDYIAEGLFEAAAHTLDETQAEDLHLVGYCVGGSMVATALAYLAQNTEHPLSDRISSCTFFTSQFDFTDAGELQIFVDDEQIKLIESYMDKGVLGAEKMQASFNMLRSADLIWSFVVSNYMLGKDPFPFDLLYWNSDSTRMPAKCHKYYLETFYRDDKLARGELQLGDAMLDLAKVTIPTYHLTAKEDHIAPAASVYRGVQKLGGDKRFICAGSGHIAGVVNPPSMKKYQYWAHEDGVWPETVEEWRETAVEHPGSWWGDWDGWLKAMNGGETVKARQPGRRHNALCDAPGEYVKIRFDEAAADLDED